VTDAEENPEIYEALAARLVLAHLTDDAQDWTTERLVVEEVGRNGYSWAWLVHVLVCKAAHLLMEKRGGRDAAVAFVEAEIQESLDRLDGAS
jgi:hypothetical protein